MTALSLNDYFCSMLKFFSKAISYLFHPLFLFYGLLYLVYMINPFAFRISERKELNITWIMAFIIVVLFPLITTLLMRGLKLVSSLEMVDPKERIGPMIATIVFYVWFFVNIKDNPSYPVALSVVALGGTIALCLSFFINNFSKISLHTVGAGSFVMGIMILLFNFSSPRIIFSVLHWGRYEISPMIIMASAIIMAGAIGSARLYLDAHRPADIYSGYLIGLFSQIVAFKILV